jgi:hypothetical protein
MSALHHLAALESQACHCSFASVTRFFQAEFIVFGGSRKKDHPGFYLEGKWKGGFNPKAPASRFSHRIAVSWTRASSTSPWQYRFSSWTREDMGYPRVMPDATLLPNGDVVLLSGAQVRAASGIGAEVASNTPMALVAACVHAYHTRLVLARLMPPQAGVAGYPEGSTALNNYPAFWATLYQTMKASNRYTLLCGTTIARLYHASASLMIDGNVLVGGADRNRYLLPMPDGPLPWFNGTVVPVSRVAVKEDLCYVAAWRGGA